MTSAFVELVTRWSCDGSEPPPPTNEVFTFDL